MTVQAMGYFWVGTSKLDDWTNLALGQLGLQQVDRGGGMRAFRMDDRKQRLIFDGGLPDGERFFGWEVADAAALDALAARLEQAGVAGQRGTAPAHRASAMPCSWCRTSTRPLHSIGVCWASRSPTSWALRCRCISCTSTR